MKIIGSQQNIPEGIQKVIDAFNMEVLIILFSEYTTKNDRDCIAINRVSVCITSGLLVAIPVVR